MMMCFICGAYYCFDNPAELEEVFEKKFNISMTKYSLMYSLYSLPNMIIPLLAGIFLNKMGHHLGLFLTSLLVTIGTSIIAYGGYNNHFDMILLGRTIFGMGAETLWVIQAVFVSNWFYD